MNIVIDTNVLVSVILTSKKTSVHYAFEHVMQHGKLLFSYETLAEFEAVLRRPKFDKYVALDKREKFLDVLDDVAMLVEINHKTTLCRDAKDNKFLDVAANGGASYLITGDDDLLVLHPFGNTEIVTALDYLKNMTQ